MTDIGMVAALRAVLWCERPQPQGLGLPLWGHQRRVLLATLLGQSLYVVGGRRSGAFTRASALNSVLYHYTAQMQKPYEPGDAFRGSLSS